MKEKIHPQYHHIVATCHCGAQYKIGSTESEVRVDICSACHPLFQGKKDQALLNKGLVDKFQKRYATTEKLKAEIAERKKKKEEAIQLATELESERKTRQKQRVRVIGKTSI